MPRAKGGPKPEAANKLAPQFSQANMAPCCLFRTATESVDKGQAYAYTGRKHRKRDFRQLWVARIRATTRQHGIAYSRFMNALKKANIRWTGSPLRDGYTGCRRI